MATTTTTTTALLVVSKTGIINPATLASFKLLLNNTLASKGQATTNTHSASNQSNVAQQATGVSAGQNYTVTINAQLLNKLALTNGGTIALPKLRKAHFLQLLKAMVTTGNVNLTAHSIASNSTCCLQNFSGKNKAIWQNTVAGLNWVTVTPYTPTQAKAIQASFKAGNGYPTIAQLANAK